MRPSRFFPSYELQVAKSSQGYGLGKHLVKSLEALGQTWQMKKIMLTVLLGQYY